MSGEKEVHEAVIQNVQDLATVFSKYKDEVLVRIVLNFAKQAFCTLDSVPFSLGLFDRIIS